MKVFQYFLSLFRKEQPRRLTKLLGQFDKLDAELHECNTDLSLEKSDLDDKIEELISQARMVEGEQARLNHVRNQLAKLRGV